MKTKMNGDSEEITIISYGVKVEGKVSSNGSIRLDGTIQGDIICQGNVTIGESGEVYGKVNGQSITIGGKVEGMINAKEKLMLESKADLKGDIYTKILVVEAGARFDGKSNMGQSTSSNFSDSSSANT
ncbi:MAG: Integral rane protein CcmA [Ignavibacteriaceae bacterium]|jgi:cytoskeletal protein CcmA (bactofilin family)|nr:Integral rane protein CcmA [Ignavibacteriaceae bacterium]